MFTGGSQFALVSTVSGGGSGLAGAATAILLGSRNALYGLSLSSLLRVRGVKKAATAQLIIDESTAMAVGQESERAARLGFYTTGIAVFVLWNLATLIGALGARAIGDPGRLRPRRRRVRRVRRAARTAGEVRARRGSSRSGRWPSRSCSRRSCRSGSRCCARRSSRSSSAGGVNADVDRGDRRFVRLLRAEARGPVGPAAGAREPAHPAHRGAAPDRPAGRADRHADVRRRPQPRRSTPASPASSSPSSSSGAAPRSSSSSSAPPPPPPSSASPPDADAASPSARTSPCRRRRTRPTSDRVRSDVPGCTPHGPCDR